MKKFFALLTTLFLTFPIFANEVWNGLVHFNNPAVLEKEIINLDGVWEYYPGQEFQTFNREQYDMAFIKVPGSWKVKAKKNFQSNIACYRIKIVGLKPNTQYGLFSRRCPATASKFFCNGNLIASYGTYSADEQNAKPANIPVYTFLQSDLIGSIELVIQVSCYSNFEAGIISPILFAERNVITRYLVSIILFIAILAGGLLFTIIINISIFIADNKLRIHLVLGFLLIGILCHLLTANANYIAWLFPSLPYGFVKSLEVVSLWISPQLFCVVMMEDKAFTKKVPFLDKILFALFSSFALVFIAFPVKYTNYLFNVLWISNLVFFFYAIFRMSWAFATSQIKVGLLISFYIIIAGGYFFDLLFPEISAKNIIQFNQITILILEIFDIFYMANNHQAVYNNTKKAMNEMKKVNSAFMKFATNDYLKLINNNNPEKVVSGDTRRIFGTILDIHGVMMYADGRALHPRNEFEAYSQFIRIIYDIIQKNHGIISSSVGNGCIALFKDSPVEAIRCAREIIREVRLLNEKNVKLGDASAMFSCGIHNGSILVGVIGHDDYYSECMLGPGVEIASRIENISLKFGIPILVSKKTIDMIEEELPCRLSLFGRSIITQEDGELYLYECHDEDFTGKIEGGEKPVPLSFKETEQDIYR